MKPARLEVVAFGPFADRQVIDIDRLGELGLFVIAGPTGAGKTSLFDAMCYALYGTLPGARSGLRQPRSDHAEAGVRSEVVFDFDAAGERWRVRRRPAHLRAKKRGTGTIEDPAEAVLFRLDPAGWQAVTSRAPEVDARCVELVGLDAAQFQRVVLLPQGRFQQLLHAKSSERRDLLRTLFASEPFERVEERLVEMARTAAGAAEAALEERRRSLAVAEDELAALAQALADGGITARPAVVSIPLGVTVPVGVTVPAPGAVPGDDHAGAPAGLAAVEHQLEREIAPALGLLARQRSAAADRLREATEAVARARAEHERQARIAELVAARSILESERPARQRAADAIAGARRVAPIMVIAERTSRLAHDADRHQARVARAGQRLVDALEHTGIAVGEGVVSAASSAASSAEPALEEIAHRLDALVAELTEAAADHRRLRELQLEHAGLVQELDGVIERRAGAAAEQADLAEAIAQVGQELEAADQASARVELLGEAAERADTAAALGSERDALAATIATSCAEVAELTAQAGALVSHLATLDHELAAERLVAARQVELEVAARQARDALDRRTRLAEVESAMGAAESAVSVAQHELAATVEAFVAGAARRLSDALVPGEPCPVCGSAEHPGVQLALDLAVTDQSAAPVELVQVDRAQARLHEAVAELSTLRTRRHELAELLAESASRPVADLADRARAARAELERAERAVVRSGELLVLHEQATTLVARARDEVTRAEQAVRHAEAQLAAVRARLGDHADIPGPDLAAAAVTARRLAADARAAGRRAHQLRERRAELDTLRTEVDGRLSGLDLDLAELRATVERIGLDITRLTADLLGRVGTVDPEERLVLVRVGQDRVVELHMAIARAAEVEAELDRARGELGAALTAASVDSLEEASLLHLPDERVAVLVADHQRWHDELARVDGALASLTVDTGPGAPPDLAEVQARADHAAEALADLTALEVTANDRRARIHAACEAVRRLDAGVGPARARAELLHRVAEVAKGNNVRKTSLEAWVLSSHLRDVVTQANLHLGPMTGGRFHLAVADDIINPRGLAGLDLEVDDELTGARRPTSSLSGGETFQASLALALGLADVVSAGSSGIRVDAVFIDEGFGSLDPEALDLAIDTLDGLRSRGALVGVVTHVEALKQALPVGVEVTRRRDGRGSRVDQPGGAPADPASSGGARRGGLAAVPDVA